MKITSNRRKRVLWSAFLLFAPCAIWVYRSMKATDFSTNNAQTSPDSDSDLRTRFYRGAVEDVTQNLQTLVPTLRTYGRHWKVTGTRRQNTTTTTIDCTVPVLFFTDDLTVSLSAENGQTRVDIRSQSRVGRGDLGENRRHIAQLLQKLDATQHQTP